MPKRLFLLNLTGPKSGIIAWFKGKFGGPWNKTRPSKQNILDKL